MGGAGSGAGVRCESERMQEATAVMFVGVGAHSSAEDAALEVGVVVWEARVSCCRRGSPAAWADNVARS